jgi:replication-associated recombination protein RarA
MAYDLKTVRGYDLYEVASALQKSIRRGDIRVAGYFALELFASGFDNYAWKRLLTVSAEDVADFVTWEIKALHESFLFVNKGKKRGTPKKGRIFLSKAVVVLCTANKSRDTDHLQNFVYDKKRTIGDTEITQRLSEAREERIEIPGYALDVHTKAGRMAGKTKDDFFKEEFEALRPRQKGLFDDLVED